jgi:hypothetical protein
MSFVSLKEVTPQSWRAWLLHELANALLLIIFLRSLESLVVSGSIALTFSWIYMEGSL